MAVPMRDVFNGDFRSYELPDGFSTLLNKMHREDRIKLGRLIQDWDRFRPKTDAEWKAEKEERMRPILEAVKRAKESCDDA